MKLFLLTFFFLYGAVHVYAYIVARHALHFGSTVGLIVGCFMVAMVVAPVLVRLAERHGLEGIARAMAYVGYVWMGLLFVFFSASVAIHVYHCLVFVTAKLVGKDFGTLFLSSKPAFIGPVAWSIVACLYGAWEAQHISTEHVVIRTPRLPAEVGNLVVAQVSDVHMGLIVRERRLARIIEAVGQANPDVIVSTGDLVDGQLDGLSNLAAMWRELNPRYGKFAVTGNHEYYAGLRPSLSITQQAGFRVLQGQSVVIAGGMVIAGVDDPAVNGRDAAGNEQALLAGLSRDRFRVLLKHRPKIDPHSLGLFDIQLSGHVHKGQIFPFNIITYCFYPIRTGLSFHPYGSSVYVSRGTGTWGPPIRFLAPPEVTFFEIVHGPAAE